MKSNYVSGADLWTMVSEPILALEQSRNAMFEVLINSIDPHDALELLQAKEKKRKPKNVSPEIIEWYDRIWSTQPEEMPRKLAETFMKMVDKMATRGNFRNYSYIDDMKSEALLSLTLYWHRFKPYTGRLLPNGEKEKSNVFAYFSTVIWQGFVRKIGKEHKLRDIKDELMMWYGQDPSWSRQAQEDMNNAITTTQQDQGTGIPKRGKGRPRKQSTTH